MDPNHPDVIRSRDFYMRFGALDYRTNAYILPDIRPLPDVANINYVDRPRAEQLVRLANSAIGANSPLRGANYRDYVYDDYVRDNRGEKVRRKPDGEFVSARRDYLAARGRAVQEYNRRLDELLALPVIQPVEEDIIFLDDIILKFWYNEQFNDRYPELTQDRILQHLIEIMGYDIDEDILRLENANAEVRELLQNNPIAQETNLEILRNLLRIGRTFIEQDGRTIFLTPRTRVTVHLTEGNIQRTESYVLGEFANRQLFENREELIEQGRGRIERILERTQNPEERNRWEAILQDINQGIIPDNLIGTLHEEKKIKIMTDIYRQLIGAARITTRLSRVEGHYEDEVRIQEFTVERPNTYEQIPQDRVLFGFFLYELPENNYGFNIDDDCYCPVTCLTRNPNFPNIINGKLEETVGLIYYNANIELYEEGLVEKVYDVHDAIARLYNITFQVGYIEEGVRIEFRKYPGKERTTKRESTNLFYVYRVRRADNHHIFNVINKEARTFLQTFALDTRLRIRSGYEDDEYRGRTNVFWSTLLVKEYINMMRARPEMLYNQIKFNEEGRTTFEVYETKENINIQELPFKDRLKINASIDKYIYVALDFEAAFKKAYSMSWCYWNDVGRFQGEEDTVWNITIGQDRTKLGEEDIKAFLNMTTQIMKRMRIKKGFIFMHNGGRYDYPILCEKLFMKCEGVKILNPIISNGGTISADIRYDGCTLYLRDSYKITSTKLADLPKMLGLGDTEKDVFMYRLYNEIFSKPRDERILEYTRIELLQKMITSRDEKYISEIRQFMEKYNQPTYNLIDIARVYCNKDVIVLRDCMMKYDELMTKDGENAFARIFTSLNRNHVIKNNKNYSRNISPLTSLTIPNLVNRVAEAEGCYEGSVKISGPLNDYLATFVRGGRCWNREQEEFTSGIINNIISNDNFYVLPEEEGLGEYLVKYGYNIEKREPTGYMERSQELMEIRNRLEEKGNCLVDFDFVSLYPCAAIALKYFPTGNARVMTVQDMQNTDVRERGITEQDNIWFAVIDLFRGPKDIIYAGDRDIEFPIMTKKDVKGKVIPIDMTEYNLPISVIDYKEIRRAYPNAMIRFKNGVVFEEKTTRFSEFINELFCKRKYYKNLGKNHPMYSVEALIKLMMNSSYGNMIRKRILTETKYASIHSFSGIRSLIYKKIKKILKDNESGYVIRGEIRQSNKRKFITKAIEICLITLIQSNPNRYRHIDTRDKRQLKNGLYEMSEDVMNILPREYIMNDVELIMKDNNEVEVYGLVMEGSNNLTHKLTYTKKIKHETRPHWGAPLLSQSKAMANEFCEKINYDVYYTDTDSFHIDGYYLTLPQVRAYIDPEDPNNPEASVGKLHSDFEVRCWNKDNYTYVAKPLNERLGLCSIKSMFANKKFYADIIFCEVHRTNKTTGEVRKFLTCYMHRRCKGMDANKISPETYERYLEGTTGITQDTLNNKAFMSKADRKRGTYKLLSEEKGDRVVKTIVPRNIENDKEAVKQYKRQQAQSY